MATVPDEAQLSSFAQHIGKVRNLSPLTTKSYLRDLRRLQLLLSEQAIDNLDAIDSQHIRSSLATLHKSGLSSASLQRWLSAVRTFFRYALQKQWLSHNPADGLRAPAKGKKLPRLMDADQAIQLVSIDGDDWHSLRDRALLELLYSSGLRLAEIANINIGDIDFGQARVSVTGKGEKGRIVPVGSFALEAIERWLKVRNERALDNEKALFVSQRGKRISHRAIQQRVKQMGQQQGISQPLHPHMLRHSFASHLLESSSDLRGVQELLGHANLSTTQIYTHLDFQHLANTYDKTHPRAHSRGKIKPGS
ncbi:MAG: tyrosine recombinase XerC [Gammaproteobacteria bacterium]|nr:tyrosine recombinase XerC [Gammaproteobacteria bacterium]MBQ0838437.1 tyrosine recombinase XerC [Gammaproteobacteria bacterium]